MVTLDCPACGAQMHIASEQLVRTSGYRTQDPPASAQSCCAPPLYHTASCPIPLQGISFWESARSTLMLLFLMACLFAIAVALVMDFEDIEVPDADANKTPALPSGTEATESTDGLMLDNKSYILFDMQHYPCIYGGGYGALEHVLFG